MNLISKKNDTILKLRQFAIQKNVQDLFIWVGSSSNVNTLCARIDKLTNKLDCTDYEFGKSLSECENKLKGDIFELFCLIWLDHFGGDREFFLCQVEWAKRDQKGIDFFAIGKEGNIVPIQCKYKADPKYRLEEGELTTFFQCSGEYTDATRGSKFLRVVITSTNNIPQGIKHYRDPATLVIDREILSKFASAEHVGFWCSLVKNTFEKVFKT